MARNQYLFAAVAAIALFAAGAVAQQGADAYHHRHPNLAAAEQLTHESAERVRAAQRANEFDLGGHAQAALGHMAEAEKQMHLAGQFINTHPDKK